MSHSSSWPSIEGLLTIDFHSSTIFLPLIEVAPLVSHSFSDLKNAIYLKYVVHNSKSWIKNGQRAGQICTWAVLKNAYVKYEIHSRRSSGLTWLSHSNLSDHLTSWSNQQGWLVLWSGRQVSESEDRPVGNINSSWNQIHKMLPWLTKISSHFISIWYNIMKVVLLCLVYQAPLNEFNLYLSAPVLAKLAYFNM